MADAHGPGQPVGRRRVVTSLLSAPAGIGLVSRPSIAADTEQAERAIQGADSLLRSLDDRVSEFTLPNGLHFIVLERHMNPVASCHTFVNAGAYDEADTQTGIAHLLEHMAFKGTARIGTTDYKQEAKVLDALDEAFYDLRDTSSSQGPQQRLQERFQQIQRQAEAFAVPNEYGALLQNAGGSGLNATTSHDSTRFFVSLPTNALELWFALESQRFQAPVFRQLYSEKRVVAEERRARVDNSAMGPYLESFMQVAFGNNYARPVIGWPQDVAAVGRKELHAFHQQHYRPSNVTIAIVGDVDPSRIQQLATKYFGSWRPGSRPSGSPGQAAPAEASKPSFHRPQAFAQAAPSGPGVMQLYYRPGMASQETLALDVISDLMDGTRGSRLERGLVNTGAALTASAMHAWPGEKHGSAFLLNAVPSSDTSLPDLAAQLQAQASRFAQESVPEQELARFCKGARADLYGAMQSNSTMASAMCKFHTLTGSWRTLITDLADFGRLSGSDVQQVAANLFTEDNSYTGYILPPSARSSSPVKA